MSNLLSMRRASVRSDHKKIANKPPSDYKKFMSKNVDWDDQRAFLAVMETGSLSA
ncbi:LysR family transcriptional regulator, partial [Sinorhizobium meliloti]